MKKCYLQKRKSICVFNTHFSYLIFLKSNKHFEYYLQNGSVGGVTGRKHFFIDTTHERAPLSIHIKI